MAGHASKRRFCDGYGPAMTEVSFQANVMTTASHSARRGRHRRTSVSRRGAGRRTDQARPAGAAGHGFARVALQRTVFEGHDRRGAERDRARPLAVVAGAYRPDARRRHRRLAQFDAPVEARSRGRLRRLSDVAAADRGAAAGRARHHSRSQRGHSAAPTVFCRSRVSAIATSLPGVLDRDPALSARPRRPARRCARRSSLPPP